MAQLIVGCCSQRWALSPDARQPHERIATSSTTAPTIMIPSTRTIRRSDTQALPSKAKGPNGPFRFDCAKFIRIHTATNSRSCAKAETDKLAVSTSTASKFVTLIGPPNFDADRMHMLGAPFADTHLVSRMFANRAYCRYR